MCRWFAYLSPHEPCLLSDVLLTPANSLSHQVSSHYLPHLLPHGQETDLSSSHDALLRMRNSLLNVDGLGVCWYTDAAASFMLHTAGPRPALYKSLQPPGNDFNLASLCENTETRCLMAHIRASSGGVVAPVNNHPFVFGRHAFMHNGVVASFPLIKRALSSLIGTTAYTCIRGSTDSEHAAALYMTYLTSDGPAETWEDEYPLQQMHAALIKTAVTIMRVQKKELNEKARRPNSLNFCVTDGVKMVAMRFRNHRAQEPPSLYWSEFAGRTLNRKFEGHPDGPDIPNRRATFGPETAHGRHTIVASEPTTYDEKQWHLIGKNHALLVDEEGDEREVRIVYEEELDAEDPVVTQPAEREE